MYIIFKFDNEVLFKEIFESVNLSTDDKKVKFSGYIEHPIDFSDKYTSSFFAIINTEDLNIPTELFAYEYSYQYPVAEGVDLRL